MRILYPTLGRGRKGFIDIRWKCIGRQDFLVAFGPVNRRSLWRAIKWLFSKK